jgi:D-arginine dehydrogenase
MSAREQLQQIDFVVIGGGIAGASAGAELAAHGRVAVLEREDQPGYHTTGRSIALYSRAYGNAVVRTLAAAAGPFLANPPAGFAEHRLLSPRGILYFARADQSAAVEQAYEAWRQYAPDLSIVDSERARDLVPVFRDGYLDSAVFEADAADIDVGALHQGFIRQLRERGGALVTGAEVTAMERVMGTWRLTTPAGDFAAPVIVNAAGAWADDIASLAGVLPAGAIPMRRTVVTFDPPEGMAIERWPAAIDIDEEFYFKPDAGQLIASPADETPSPPCDAQPEELDVATAIDRFERATTHTVARVNRKWAGLRTFAPDRLPIVGPDPDADGLFWLAGQGGVGIMTSPSMARLAADLIVRGEVPADLADLGLTAADVSIARFGGVTC